MSGACESIPSSVSWILSSRRGRDAAPLSHPFQSPLLRGRMTLAERSLCWRPCGLLRCLAPAAVVAPHEAPLPGFVDQRLDQPFSVFVNRYEEPFRAR